MEKDNGEKSAVKVYIRVRPLINKEYGSKEIVSVEEDVLNLIIFRIKPLISIPTQ